MPITFYHATRTDNYRKYLQVASIKTLGDMVYSN